MDLKYWIDKWKTGDTKFHRPEYQPALVKLFPADPPGTVFVPLCGKTRDMLWFLEKGWSVIGVEAVEMAARAFFDENNLAFTEEHRGAFKVFKATPAPQSVMSGKAGIQSANVIQAPASASVTIWCGDFFSLKKENLFAVAAVAAVYDRASLIALSPDLRAKYAAHMAALLPPGIKYFLIVMEYPQEKVMPPPFSVEEPEIRRLFGESFSITQLRRRADTVTPGLIGKFEGVEVWESVYLMGKI
jgi:thiopurine S-methyltransferase